MYSPKQVGAADHFYNDRLNDLDLFNASKSVTDATSTNVAVRVPRLIVPVRRAGAGIAGFIPIAAKKRGYLSRTNPFLS
jgi:hypothetical protein